MEKRLFNFWKPCVLKHKLPLEKFNRSEFIIWQCEHQSKILKKKKINVFIYHEHRTEMFMIYINQLFVDVKLAVYPTCRKITSGVRLTKNY